MLILTRRPAETIYIGEEVTVTVLGVVGNQVRFGIDAPRSIVIDRAEIHERKKRAAQLANGNLGPEDEPAPDEIDGNVEGTSGPASRPTSRPASHSPASHSPASHSIGELRPRLSVSKPAEVHGDPERALETGRHEERHETEVNGNVAFKRR